MQQLLRHISAVVQPSPFGLIAAAIDSGGVPARLPSTDITPGLEFVISEDLRRLLDLPSNPLPANAGVIERHEEERRASPIFVPMSQTRRATEVEEPPRPTFHPHADITRWQPPRPPEAERPPVIGVPLVRPPAPNAPRIANRAQALQALKEFEADRAARLPQLAPGRPAADLLGLASGVVRFSQLGDLLATFPCALRVAAPPPMAPGAPFPADAVVYPRGPGDQALPRRALLQAAPATAHLEEIVTTRHPADRRQVRFSVDLRRWHPTGIYTDHRVEAEKLALWARIFSEAAGRAQALSADAPRPDPRR
ncbi:hypothetical protein GN316_13970 [Xylophilus sp. Kf1]|nr:hypothetical protein [Xylophilus sp. Kf1]